MKEDWLNNPVQMDALDFLQQLPDSLVQCCVTSPPYYGLRSYSGEQERTWGGIAECEHEWGDEMPGVREGGKGVKDTGRFCQKCGAWKGGLGQEPTMDQYISNLVEIFQEVKRVLRPDGVLWLNLGDSYYADSFVREDSQERWERKGDETYDTGNTRRSMVNEPYLKKKDLMAVPWRVAIALQKDGWYLRSGIPWVKKCLSGGTILYARTQKGEMPAMLKDLVRLDPSTVQLWNGKKWTQVLSWDETPRPDNPIEIELRSGERIGCTHEHRWPIEGKGNVEARDLKVGDKIQTTVLPEPKQEEGFCSALDDDLVSDNEIVAIRKSRARYFYDVSVEDEPHLFALASGVLTHNSAMPESVQDRPTVSHEYIFLFSKNSRYFYDIEAIRVPLAVPDAKGHPFGGTKRAGGDNPTYSGRAYDPSHLSGRNRRTGDWLYESLDILIDQTRSYLAHLEKIKGEGGLLEGPDGNPLGMLVNPQPFSEAHFAVFPPRLIEPLIKAGTPGRVCAECRAPWEWEVESESVATRDTTDTKFGVSEDDIRGTAARERRVRVTYSRELIPSCDCADDSINAIVLDPFLGSGTIGLVAKKLGRDWLGCDISLEYCELGKKRMESSGEMSVDAFLDL